MMNVVGRQMSRSNSTAHHQRQYSDNFLDNGRWLQSSSQVTFQMFFHFLNGLFSVESFYVLFAKNDESFFPERRTLGTGRR